MFQMSWQLLVYPTPSDYLSSAYFMEEFMSWRFQSMFNVSQLLGLFIPCMTH